MIEELGIKSKKAKSSLLCVNSVEKKKALLEIAKELRGSSDYIVEQNEIDMKNAREKGMSEAMLDRLSLSKERVFAVAEATEKVAESEDSVGKIIGGGKMENGLEIQKITVPLGTIAVIFEARPNVAVDAAVLCLKSGNCVILRGGKEAIETNKALVQCMRKALEKTAIDSDAILIVEDTSRESALELMKMKGYVDVLIPRGGAGLIRSCVENATVPVIETGTGNCHVYIHKDAEYEMAEKILFNAKTSRISVCNSAESLLIDKEIAESFLPRLKKKLDEKNVILHGDEASKRILPEILSADDEDFRKEYLAYEMSVKVVRDVFEAAEHINEYSTGHSEVIVTDNYEAAREFVKRVDSAAVYVNASTRFTDGGEFGKGAEIGISTQKLHARGPLGLEDLVSYKYIILGNGQIR